jgi:hypothetical protein
VPGHMRASGSVDDQGIGGGLNGRSERVENEAAACDGGIGARTKGTGMTTGGGAAVTAHIERQLAIELPSSGQQGQSSPGGVCAWVAQCSVPASASAALAPNAAGANTLTGNASMAMSREQIRRRRMGR